MDADGTSEDATNVVVVDPRAGSKVLASWPLDHAAEPCLADVDRLAKLQLAAVRMGLRVRVVHPTAALSSLLDGVGLGSLIDPADAGRGTAG